MRQLSETEYFGQLQNQFHLHYVKETRQLMSRIYSHLAESIVNIFFNILLPIECDPPCEGIFIIYSILNDFG